MRVLQLVQKPQRRGAEVFAHGLAGALEREGHASAIAYLYPYAGGAPLVLGESDQVLGGDEGHPMERITGVHPGLLREVRRAIADFAPDVVQLNGSRTVKYGAFARCLDGSAGWAAVYRNIGNPDDWLRGTLRRSLYRLLMTQIDGVASVSAATLDRVAAMHGLRVPTAQIPRGVDVARIREAATAEPPDDGPPAAIRVVSVGSLTPEKRMDRWLRVFAAARARVPGLRGCLVGDGPEREALERLRSELGLDDDVEMLGARDDVPTILSGARLLLLTSDTEGIPGVILEAGALGIPAVATRVGGVEECVVDGETGIVRDREDERGLADAVVRLASEAGAARDLGARAARLVEERFDLPEIARRYVALYARVIAARPR